MKAIAGGNLAGFPTELITVYVECEIIGEKADMTVLDYIMSGELVEIYLYHINSRIVLLICAQQRLYQHLYHIYSCHSSALNNASILICITSTVTLYYSSALNSAYITTLSIITCIDTKVIQNGASEEKVRVIIVIRAYLFILIIRA